MAEYKHKYDILSLDGGGIRGVISTRLLIEFESRTGKSISELFDFIIGVSIGSLISSWLVVKENPEDVDDKIPLYTSVDLLYKFVELGPHIFPQAQWFFQRWINNIYAYFYPKYSNDFYISALEKYLGEYKISDTIIPVAYTSLNLNTSMPFIWSTYNAKRDPGENYYLKDAVLASSAAPTYFAAHKATAPDKNNIFTYHIDGGLVNNNPILDGISEFLSYHNDEQTGEKTKPEDIFAVSIGTGVFKDAEGIEKVVNAGKITWISKPHNIIDLMFDTNAIAANEKTKFLLNEKFFRLQVEIPFHYSSIDNSDIDNVCGILIYVENYINENSEKIDDILMQIDEEYDPTVIRSPIFDLNDICEDYRYNYLV